MKVGTDAVLLGAWVDVGGAKKILDVGTGSGVIALMMAQRSEFVARVDAVEPDSGSALEARGNVEGSPWPDKIKIHNTPVQEFHSEDKYDLIVSNPPFFTGSLLPPKEGRKIARHRETLTFDELLTAVKRLLDERGTFAVVLPVAEGNLFREQAGRYGLVCHRSMAFYSRKGKSPERWLMEFSFEGRRKKTEPEMLVLYEKDEQWSDPYIALTKEFYVR